MSMDMAIDFVAERAPTASAVCEHFLGSVRRECLNHLLIFSNGQLYRVIKEYVGFFNRAPPHQGIAQEIPDAPYIEAPAEKKGKMIAFPVFNGLHHDYQRVA